MSKRILQTEIDCGDTTCASEPGKFCAYVRVSGFGRKYSCGRFAVKLDEKDGWLRRCFECLAAEIKENV